MEIGLRAQRGGWLHAVGPRDRNDGGDRGGAAATLRRHDAGQGQSAFGHAAPLFPPWPTRDG
jgi:hypothetical protein